MYRFVGQDVRTLPIDRVRKGKTWLLEGDLISAVSQAMLMGAVMYSAIAKVYAVVILPPDGYKPFWWTFADWRRPDQYHFRHEMWGKDKLFVSVSCAEAVMLNMATRVDEDAALENMEEWSQADYLWWLYGLHQECCLAQAVQSLLPVVSRPTPNGPPQLDELQLFYGDLSCLRLTTDGPKVDEPLTQMVIVQGAQKGDTLHKRVVHLHDSVGGHA